MITLTEGARQLLVAVAGAVSIAFVLVVMAPRLILLFVIPLSKTDWRPELDAELKP